MYRFRRQLVSTDYNEDRSLQQLQYVLVAVGTLQVEEEGQSSVSKHAHAAASQCACNVTACEHACTCPGGLLYQMLKLHGKTGVRACSELCVVKGRHIYNLIFQCMSAF